MTPFAYKVEANSARDKELLVHGQVCYRGYILTHQQCLEVEWQREGALSSSSPVYSQLPL